MVLSPLTSRLCHQQSIVHLENSYSMKVTGMFIDMAPFSSFVQSCSLLSSLVTQGYKWVQATIMETMN